MPPKIKTNQQKPKTNTSNSTHTQTNSPPKTNPTTRNNQSNRLAVEQFAQAVHLIEGFADTLDAIPPSLTRSLSDLKELDAVLSAPLNQVHSTLDQLLNSFQNPNSIRPDQRLQLLQDIVADIEKYNLGGQDKIRVANGTCESLSHHIRQLDTTTSLLISSLPPSLEPRIPASSFPSGYPKLTGSLRSKPVGGVWLNSTHPQPDHQITSPPSMPSREFMNFAHHQSPIRESDSNARSIDTQPVSKRARIDTSGSNSLTASSHLNLTHPIHQDESNQTRRSHQQTGISSKLLDQHMIYSQSSIKRNRPPHELVGSEENLISDQLVPVEHSITGRLGKPTSTSLSRQNSQLSLVNNSPPHPNNLLSTGTKNKRTRITSNLVGNSVDHDEYGSLSHPALKINCPPNQSQSTSQQPTMVGPKKRVRKSNPIGSIGKNADSINQPSEDSTNMTKRMNEQTNHAIMNQEVGASRTIGDHTKGINLGLIGGSSIKKTSVSAGRGANNSKNGTTSVDQASLPVPVTTKRTYTKRNGMNNGGISLSKSKRAGRKKTIGVLAAPFTDPSNGNTGAHMTEVQVEENNDKDENKYEQQRGRVKQSSILKESVRLEDFVEGAGNKVRQRKLTSNMNSISAGIEADGNDLKKEKDNGGMGDEGKDEREHEENDVDEDRLNHQTDHGSDGTSLITRPPPPPPPIISHENKSNMKQDFSSKCTTLHYNEARLDDGNNNTSCLVESEVNFDGCATNMSPKESVQSNDSSRTYCFCKGEVYGDRMVACDNVDCPIEWFHYQCAGLTEDPTGNWFCPDCQSKGFGRIIGNKSQVVVDDLVTGSD